MPEPVWTFSDGVSGSDTLSSGAGPATAINGNNADINGTTTIDLATDSPDLSGIATDGSHGIWIESTSGIRFFRIDAVNDTLKTITTHSAATGTETIKWAIGGERATISGSLQLFDDDLTAGAEIELKADQTITATLNFHASGGRGDPCVLRSDIVGTKRTINGNVNGVILDFNNSGTDYMELRDLKIQCTAATKTSSIGISARNKLKLIRCEVGDATNQLNDGIKRGNGSPDVTLFKTSVHECIAEGIFMTSSCFIRACGVFINNNGKCGIRSSGGAFRLHAHQLIVSNNGENGVQMSAGGQTSLFEVSQSIFEDNAEDGISKESTNNSWVGYIVGSQFTNNGVYGISSDDTDDDGTICTENNNFYGNGTAARNNFPAGPGDTALDPQYASAGTNDYAIGNTALRDKGFHPSAENIGTSNTKAYTEPGIQRQETGAGGGGGPTSHAHF